MNYEIKKKEEFESYADYWDYLSKLFFEFKDKVNEVNRIRRSIKPHWIKEIQNVTQKELDL